MRLQKPLTEEVLQGQAKFQSYWTITYRSGRVVPKATICSACRNGLTFLILSQFTEVNIKRSFTVPG